MSVMRILAICFWVLALVSYLSTVRALRTLVREARQHSPTARLTFIWWIPAWKIHREACPASTLRNGIVARFAITFLMMLVGIVCLAVDVVHHQPTG
jgi:hypothetical protein